MIWRTRFGAIKGNILCDLRNNKKKKEQETEAQNYFRKKYL